MPPAFDPVVKSLEAACSVVAPRISVMYVSGTEAKTSISSQPLR